MPEAVSRPLEVAIVGGGPVASLLAIELRKRRFEVNVYEKSPDTRRHRGKSHSFNLTLTLRGLGVLDPELRAVIYSHGVVMPQRIIHNVDRTVVLQRYGFSSGHHLLSVPRDLLHRALQERAERAGARFFFQHECVSVDPEQAAATFAVPDGMRTVSADLLIGCDGANSVVRQEMSRRGARMRIAQDYIAHGYVESRMPPDAHGGHVLLGDGEEQMGPRRSREHGLHIWPRGEFMLLAQPNRDYTYTASLFMPLDPGGESRPGLRSLTSREALSSLFARCFPDVRQLQPAMSEDFLAAPPAALKVITCQPYHHERTVLVGDAAHTMVPFYGQGINCSFEDVATFCEILDSELAATEPGQAIPAALSAYTAARSPQGAAIAELSLSNLAELAEHTGQSTFHARNRLEKSLHLRYPDEFMPLYDMVAFTRIPYTEAVQRYERDTELLDELCTRFDASTDIDRIIEEFGHARAATSIPEPVLVPPAGRLGADLNLSAPQQQSLLHAVTDRISRYQRDLRDGRFPASYVHDSTDVMAYEHGRALAARLREHGVPEHGTGLDTLLDVIFDEAVPSGTMHPHPGFLAHVPSGGLFQGAVGEFIARVLNRFVGMWTAAPGISQLESNVITWFCRILGYGDGSFGYLTTGGSVANFMALRCALDHRRVDPGRATVYVSEQGHFSVTKAARLAGIGAGHVRTVETDPEQRLDVAALRALIERDRAAGLVPTCVVATAGTTNTGAVDDLGAATRLGRELDLWVHVDACLGGFFRLTERGRSLLESIEQADSIAVDAHKSLFLPHGSSALLVKDKQALPAAFGVPGGEYLPGFTADDDLVDFCNYGPELTREVRGLTAWLPIKLHGIKAFEYALDHTLDLADHLEHELRQLGSVQLTQRGSPHLPVVNFQPAGASDARRTERLCELICSRGRVYVTTTTIPGQGPVVRACILHHQTDKSTVDQLVDDTRWALARLAKEPANP